MGEINYLLGAIETGVAGIHGLNAQFQDTSTSMVSKYTTLDSNAAGQATNSAMEFSNQASHVRQQISDAVQQLGQAVLAAKDDMHSLDQGFMGRMG